MEENLGDVLAYDFSIIQEMKTSITVQTCKKYVQLQLFTKLKIAEIFLGNHLEMMFRK